MDKLFKSEQDKKDLKENFDAVCEVQDSAKDKKIIELAKKNRNLQMTVESLKTKAAKAAEVALKFKGEL